MFLFSWQATSGIHVNNDNGKVKALVGNCGEYGDILQLHRGQMRSGLDDDFSNRLCFCVLSKRQPAVLKSEANVDVPSNCILSNDQQRVGV